MIFSFIKNKSQQESLYFLHLCPPPSFSCAPSRWPVRAPASWRRLWPTAASVQSQASVCWALRRCETLWVWCTPAACTTSLDSSLSTSVSPPFSVITCLRQVSCEDVTLNPPPFCSRWVYRLSLESLAGSCWSFPTWWASCVGLLRWTSWETASEASSSAR